MEVLTNEHTYGETEDVDIEELKQYLTIPRFKRIILHDVLYARERWGKHVNNTGYEEIIDDGKRVLSIHHSEFFPKNATERMKAMIRWLLDQPELREIVLDEFYLVHLPFHKSKSDLSVISG